MACGLEEHGSTRKNQRDALLLGGAGSHDRDVGNGVKLLFLRARGEGGEDRRQALHEVSLILVEVCNVVPVYCHSPKRRVPQAASGCPVVVDCHCLVVPRAGLLHPATDPASDLLQ